MISIAPTETGFGFIDFLTVIAMISLYYLKWKGIRNVPYATYILLSVWLGLLQIPFAVAWNRSWSLIGNLLLLMFFWGCRIIQAILLILAIKPALITAFATNPSKADEK